MLIVWEKYWLTLFLLLIMTAIFCSTQQVSKMEATINCSIATYSYELSTVYLKLFFAIDNTSTGNSFQNNNKEEHFYWLLSSVFILPDSMILVRNFSRVLVNSKYFKIAEVSLWSSFSLSHVKRYYVSTSLPKYIPPSTNFLIVIPNKDNHFLILI